jgi:hypothetical protein
MNPETLRARAVRAYEIGRLRAAFTFAAPIGVLAAIAVSTCAGRGREYPAAAAVAAVALLVIAFEWWGGAPRQGARLGLVAGLAPFLLPLLSIRLGPILGAPFCPPSPAILVAAGVVAGFALGARGALRGGGPGYWAAAGSIVLGCGAAGCLAAGVSGLAGLALGLAVGLVPAVALARAR